MQASERLAAQAELGMLQLLVLDVEARLYDIGGPGNPYAYDARDLNDQLRALQAQLQRRAREIRVALQSSVWVCPHGTPDPGCPGCENAARGYQQVLWVRQSDWLQQQEELKKALENLEVLGETSTP